jgi:hypothetical protein
MTTMKMSKFFVIMGLLLIAGNLFAQPGPCTPQANFQHIGESQCIAICPGAITTICVGPIADPHQVPLIFILPGCSPLNTRCNVDCPFPIPPFIFWAYDPTAWTYNPATGMFCNTIIGSEFGCLCVTLEGFLAVEMGHFAAVAGDGAVSLLWNTLSERELDRFEVQRSTNGADAQLVGSVTATNTAAGSRYEFTDRSVQNGIQYHYALVVINRDGSREETGLTADATPNASAVPTAYALFQNYPNPFNPTTRIRFDLLDAGHVSLKVFELTGREVATLVDGNLAAGAHEVDFAATNLPTGVYLYRLTAANGFSATRRMLLIK